MENHIMIMLMMHTHLAFSKLPCNAKKRNKSGGDSEVVTLGLGRNVTV
jgi:hypothetical protein